MNEDVLLKVLQVSFLTCFWWISGTLSSFHRPFSHVPQASAPSTVLSLQCICPARTKQILTPQLSLAFCILPSILPSIRAQVPKDYHYTFDVFSFIYVPIL